MARCAGALGGCPRERAGGGRGARRAGAAANGPAERRSGEGRGGGAEGRGRLDRSGLPLPEVGGALAAGERGCSLCSWISHSDRRHFTALRAPSSFLPPSSSPLTLLPVVTSIRFTGTKVPPPRSVGVGKKSGLNGQQGRSIAQARKVAAGRGGVTSLAAEVRAVGRARAASSPSHRQLPQRLFQP